MSPSLPDTPSAEAMHVLGLLRRYHNVILSGPVATGKSLLLSEVIHWFTRSRETWPGYDPVGGNPFPDDMGNYADFMPSENATDRRAWSVTFHQGTKYRDFVCGVMPDVTPENQTFRYIRGPLMEGADFAEGEGCASLVVIDEINRGPAVAVFGDLIAAIETDKRKLPDGGDGPFTVPIRVLTEEGNVVARGLSHDLYIIAAMNEADTSVEPLDVAFRRRFRVHRLLPDESRARAFLGVPTSVDELPETPGHAENVYQALIMAWNAVNQRIELARGAEFMMGHGMLMDGSSGLPTETTEALRYAAQVWGLMFSHVSEVFFGDVRGMAAVLDVGSPGHPYRLEETLFADNPVARLVGPTQVSSESVFLVLKSICGS